MTSLRHRLASLVCLVLVSPLACAHPPPPPLESAPPPTPPASGDPLPTTTPAPPPAARDLRLPGARALPPVERAGTIPARFVGRHVDGAYETAVLSVSLDCPTEASVWVEAKVGAKDGRVQPWSGLVTSGREGLEAGTLVVRRPVADAAAGNVVHLYTAPAACNGYRGEHLRVALPDMSKALRDRQALVTWARALAGAAGGGSWGAFARARLEEIYFPPPPPPPIVLPPPGARAGKGGKRGAAAGTPGARPPGSARPLRTPLVEAPRRNPNDLARLMDTTTGMTSLQETLQQDRRLLSDAGVEAATIPIDKLERPKTEDHPWREMLASLGRPVPDEPLAAAAPADFYFLRFRSLPDLLRVIDEADAWMTPSGQVMSGALEDHDLAARIETELGLGRGPLTRTLGPSVVTDLAVVGSDPYLRDGSDVTVIFRVKAAPAFDAALGATMAGHAARHGGVTSQTAGDVTSTVSADGAVRQHRAAVGGFHLVSNSRRAVERVIATIRGKAPRLGDELDFRYMLARDAGVRADVLGFMSDRFVAAVVGPRQKVLAARRQLAAAELLTPGYAALLHGWVYGRAPAGADELVASGLLRKDELRHGRGGEEIAWQPGRAARSSWGTPRALTPLADLPDPDKVTPLERDAYELFARGYQSYWRTYVDPVAVRLALDGEGAGGPMRVDVRVLPIISGSDYDEVGRTVGAARVVVKPIARGLRTVLGVGRQAKVRRMLHDMTRELPFGGKLDIDWLGDWAVLGLEDDARPVQLFLDNEMGAPSRLPDEERRARSSEQTTLETLVELPVYAGIALRSRAPAVLFLTGVRHEIEKAAPGAISWKEAGQEAGVPFVAIRAGDDASHDMMLRSLPSRLALYYAFCPDSFILSLGEATLRRRIAECKSGGGPQPAPAGNPGGKQEGQWLLELGAEKGGPLWSGLAQVLGQIAVSGEEKAAASAQAVLRGSPGVAGGAARALALDTLGFQPITAEGRDFTLGHDGITDPLRGSPHAPRRPALPVPGSPAEKLLEALAHAGSAVAFDDEPGRPTPPRQSLHVVLRLRGAR